MGFFATIIDLRTDEKRATQMASVRKRIRNGKMEGWVTDYFDQQGKRHIKTFRREKDAKAWLAEVTIEVRHGVHTPERSSITVARAAELWLERAETENLERSTLKQYDGHCRLHIIPALGNAKLSQLSTPVIERYRDDLLRKGSRAMARKVLVSLRGVLGEAQRRGLVAQNVAAGVRVAARKRENGKLVIGRDIPSKAEINAILNKAEGRWRPLFITAVFSGMRASELRGLAWPDIDFERRVIHVRQRADLWGAMGAPKSEAGDREIPMSPRTVNALREWRLECPGGKLGLVFPNGIGNVENHANIANRGFYALQIKTGIVDEAGRPKYSMHSLRHFAASIMIEQNFSPKRLQAMLGHASLAMTYDRYGHLFPSLEDDHDRMADSEKFLTATKVA
jgi:integrase